MMGISFLQLTIADPLEAQEAGASKELQSSLHALLASSLFTNVQCAIKVVSLEENKTIFERNASLLLRPASTLKLFTSASALLALDTGYIFRTSVFGKIDTDSVWTLCIRGGADPLFAEKDIQKWAENISARGVKRVRSILLDASLLDSLYWGKGWMWDDEPYSDQPFLSAFPIEHNVIHVTARAQNSMKNVEVRLSPDWDLFRVENTSIISAEKNLTITRAHETNTIRISGSLPSGQEQTAELSMWDTPTIVHNRMVTRLRSAGISILNDTVLFVSLPTGFSLLAEVSHRISSVLKFMNKESDNLSAELILKTLASRVKKHHWDTVKGLHVMKTLLASLRVDTSQLDLADGSGLSFYNLVTVEAVTSLLTGMWKSPYFDAWKKTFAIGGIDGTLKNRLRSVEGAQYVLAKTGTISGVSNIAGYILPTDGSPLAFVMYMQNYSGKYAPYRQVQDEMISHLIQYSRSRTAVKRSR